MPVVSQSKMMIRGPAAFGAGAAVVSSGPAACGRQSKSDRVPSTPRDYGRGLTCCGSLFGMRWLVIALTLSACKVKDPPPVTEQWKDPFERGAIGHDYYQSGKGYGITNGMLSARGAHNHPLWLRKKLPHDVRIEFDAWSNEERGDIKVEVFGDGRSYD